MIFFTKGAPKSSFPKNNCSGNLQELFSKAPVMQSHLGKAGGLKSITRLNEDPMTGAYQGNL